MKKILVVFLSICLSINLTYAHGDFISHCEDIMQVLGFDYNTRLFSRNKDTKGNKSWTKIISSDMIDNTDFHKVLEKNHNGFKISSPRRHRYLFHWPYDITEPWSYELEHLVIDYCEQYDLNIESNIRIFKSEIQSEHNKRKRLIEKETQRVFGLNPGGVEGYIYAHFLISMAYNIHLLGDYTSDNSELRGLYPYEKLVERICEDIKSLDPKESHKIIKGIQRVNFEHSDVQEKADYLMLYLKNQVPLFIKSARKGSFKYKLEINGIKFNR